MIGGFAAVLGFVGGNAIGEAIAMLGLILLALVIGIGVIDSAIACALAAADRKNTLT